MNAMKISVYVAEWRDVPTSFPARETILDQIAKAAMDAADREAERCDIVVRVSIADPED